MSFAVRVQTGVAFVNGAWHVVRRETKPGRAPETTVFDPPFDTEAEAEAKASEMSRVLREVVAKHGGEVRPR